MTDREKEILEDMMYMGYDRTSHKKKEIDSIIYKALKVYRNREELTTIKTSDGKEYEIENDGLILKSEALKQIYEKSIKINNPDTRNGLVGAFNILYEMNTSKKYIDGDLLFSKIAGHSDYHGDNILVAIICLQEGKKIKHVLAIGDND